MAHPALLVQLRDGRSAQVFAARGAHLFHNHRSVGFVDDGGDHFAALVDLGDDHVSLMLLVTCDSGAGPRGGARRAQRAIFKHVHNAFSIHASGDDAAAIGAAR